MTNFYGSPCAALLLLCTSLYAQNSFPDGKLDPTRNLTTSSQPQHDPLPEEYIWTAGDATINRPTTTSFPGTAPNSASTRTTSGQDSASKRFPRQPLFI